METYSRIRSIKLKRPTPEHPFGFSVRGGHEHGTGVFVSAVVPKTIAHRQGLKIGDQILRVNGYPVSAAVHHECLSLMKNRTNLHLKVRSVGMLPVREKTGEPLTWKLVEETISNNNSLILEVPVNNRQHSQRHHQTSRISDTSSQTDSRGGGGGGAESFHGIESKVYINTSGESGLGCCICKGPPERPGIFVQSTKSNGVAREGGLRPGDQILFCNGHSFHNVPFAEAVQHLKSSKHLNLAVLKGAASDLFPGESSGYNSSASSLNGETHNLSVSGASNLTTTVSSGSSNSGSDEHSIHSEVVVEQHEPPKRLSVVNEEQHQQDPGSLMKKNTKNAHALDRNMEWDEVEQVWHSAEKESLIIEIKGEGSSTNAGSVVGQSQKQQQQHIQTQQELIRLAEERKKLEQEQKRLLEEANRLEEEKRKFEEEKRQAALILMNEANNQQQQRLSSSCNNLNTMGSIASRTSSSSSKSTHSLHGALTQEILKRNERRENGNVQEPSMSRNENYEHQQPPMSDFSAGTIDQKKSLFTATPIIDDEKRQQHEQLIQEFKRAHRKMFAHGGDDGPSAGVNNGTSGTGTAETPQNSSENHDPTQASSSSSSSSTSSSTTTTSANSHFPRGTEPERESFRAKRIQKEVEHAKKMIEQRLAGVARQRLLRIERQHQECRETQREVSKHGVPHKKKGPPPPPPLPTVVEDCSIDQIEHCPEVICNGQYTNNYIQTAVENRSGAQKGTSKKTELNSLPASERPESPSPDYSNSPSPTPESERQTIDVGPDKIVQMTSYSSVYTRPTPSRLVQQDTSRNNGYNHGHPNYNHGVYGTGQDEIINGLSRCQLSSRLQNEIKSNGNNGVTILVNGGGSSTNYANKYTNHHHQNNNRSNGGILKAPSHGHNRPAPQPPIIQPHHHRYEPNTNSNSNSNNNNLKTISFGQF